MTDLVPNKMYKAGDIIFQEGDVPSEGIFYICYGDVEISRNEFGKERSLAKLSEGGVFGEMGIINSSPRNATVRALSDCGCHTITQEQFQHHVKQLDPLMRGVFRCFALTIRDFLAQQEMWAQQLQGMMQQMQQADLASPSDSGRLAEGQARKMHY